MPTIPPTITPAPAAPQRGDRTTFSARVDAFLTWLIAAVTQFGAVATNAYNNAVEASNAATNAGASASSAATQVGLAAGQVTLATTQATAASSSASAAASSVTQAQIAAAAAAAGAGLPALAGNAGKILRVKADETGFDWQSSTPIDIQEFTASGTWTKPAGATVVRVEVWAGGGGGANSTTASTSYCSGGYGGEYADKLLKAEDVATSVTITVGLGGAGSANAANANGNDGGGSSFGSVISARGGLKGKYSTSLSIFVGYAGSTETATPVQDGGIWLLALRTPGANRGLCGCPLGSSSLSQGGDTMAGGAGGGGVYNAQAAGVGGVSKNGGNGGAGNYTAATKGGNGSFPSGGGGASTNNGGGGDGANGFVRVTCW